MRRLYLFLLLTMLLCIGCEWRLGNSVEEPEGLVAVNRYDRIQSLYLTTGDVSALQQMNTEYPQQTRTLIENVLHIGKVNDPQINTRFLSFYQDTTLQTVIAETQRQYADMTDINKQLSDAFENLLKLLPNLCIPEVYAQIGSFDQSIVVSGSSLGVSLDKYLGTDYPFYRDHYSESDRALMKRDMIVPDCLVFYLLSLYPLPKDLQQEEHDIHIGRILYVVNHLMQRQVFKTEYVDKAAAYMHKHPNTSLTELLQDR